MREVQETGEPGQFDARTITVMVKLNEFERDMWRRVAESEGSQNMSETLRRLVRDRAKREGLL